MTGGTGRLDARADGTADATRGRTLIALARGALEAVLNDAAHLPPIPNGPQDAWLHQVAGSFVTLHVPGPAGSPQTGPRLRGCIGTIEAYRPLGEDVQGNALAAAFRDPRFPELTAAEYGPTPQLDVEVSVLSPREPLPYADRAELVGLLRPGVDGLVLEHGGRRGTYLPQVWEQIPDPDTFLASLVQKAGLPAGFWSDEILMSRYTVTAFHEDGR